MNRLRFAALACLAAACGDEGSLASALGGARVEVTTTGEDRDPDGYAISIDDLPARIVPTNEALVLTDLAPGAHTVKLDHVAPNCQVNPQGTRSFTVSAGDTAHVMFEVGCLATGIRVTNSTSGLDPDAAYTVLVDGTYLSSLTANSTAEITRLTPGEHRVELGDVASNCRVAGPAVQYVFLVAGSRDPVSFTVNCVGTTGAIRVNVVTDGEDRDPDGYTVLIDGRRILGIPPTGTFLVLGVSAGKHMVSLSDATRNCLSTGEAHQEVEIGGPPGTRDTISVEFEVICARTHGIAFEREARIGVARADGSNVQLLRTGWNPAWSPDGSQLAFLCGGPICLMGTDGSAFTSIPPHEGVVGFAWSPVGNRFAFAKQECDSDDNCTFAGLYLIGADLSGRERIPTPGNLAGAADVEWSPDGASLVFTCYLRPGGATDICVIGTDGSGFRAITTGQSPEENSWDPSWSPNGSEIVFVTTRASGLPELASVRPDGTRYRRLNSGMNATNPAWSPDGRRILFSHHQCNGDVCSPIGISVLNVETVTVTRLTSGPDRSPAWRP